MSLISTARLAPLPVTPRRSWSTSGDVAPSSDSVAASTRIVPPERLTNTASSAEIWWISSSSGLPTGKAMPTQAVKIGAITGAATTWNGRPSTSRTMPGSGLRIKGAKASPPGRLTACVADFVPESERPKVYRSARSDLAIYAATIGLAIGLRSWLPVLLIGGPRLYGALLLHFYSFTQHAGMGENVLDHRLNTRTVKMCRLNRFLYWNMNYHVEHHMFPMVPYHALPRLHEIIKADCPPPYRSTAAAYAEILAALRRQVGDPTYHVERPLPARATPAATA